MPPRGRRRQSLREDSAVTERAIAATSNTGYGRAGIIHVEKFFIGREAHTVRLGEITRFQMQLSVGRDPE